MDKRKKILTIITIFLAIIVCILSYFIYRKYTSKNQFANDIIPFAEKNENVIFKINKIVFFSNCDAKNKTGSNTNFTLENLYQYTDMAIFIDAENFEKTYKNTFKKVNITNIKFDNPPILGEPHLYFKGLNQFAKSDFSEENLINDNLDFIITAEDDANLETPTLYNNLANPITLSYVNSNIKSDYTITNTSSPIVYDGSLLKKCNISLDSINCSMSFDVYITNNMDEEYKCTVYIDIPLDNGTNSIYDGSFTLNKDCNFIFYRYK